MHPVKAISLPRHLGRAAAALLFLVLAGWAAAGLAQSTGGSFGGGDWGDSGGGGGGGSHGGGSHSDGGVGLFIDLVLIAFRIHPLFGLLVLVVGAIILIAGASRDRSGSRRWSAPPPTSGPMVVPNFPSPQRTPGNDARAWMGADVTQLRIALDPAARPAFDQAFAQLSSTPDVRTGTKHGRLQIVHRTAQLLRANERHWRLAAEMNYHPMSPPQASGVFQRLVAATRSAAAQASADGTRPDGLFFITFVVAARREIVDFAAHRPEQVRMVLDDLGRLDERDLVSVDVMWLPSEAGLGLTEPELRRLFPELKQLGGAQSGEGAPSLLSADQRLCSHCHSPTPRAAPRCVHCGAPRPG
jgi:hypothetical protein